MRMLVSVAYGVILLFSTWIVLNPRIPTKILGTAGFSGLALGAFLSIFAPARYNAEIERAELMLVLSAAVLSVWFFFRWMRKRMSNDGI